MDNLKINKMIILERNKRQTLEVENLRKFPDFEDHFQEKLIIARLNLQ